MDEQIAYEDLHNLLQKKQKMQMNTIEQSINGYYCPCSICETLVKECKSFKRVNNEKEALADSAGTEISFSLMLNELGKASKQSLIKLNIPETAIFIKGKPIALIYQKPDGSLKMTMSPLKLKLSELKKRLMLAAKRRKSSKTASSSKSGVAVIRYLYEENNKRQLEGSALNMNVIQFSNLMLERPGSAVWKKISYIQSAVRCEMGSKELHTVKYYSHNSSDLSQVFQYQRAGTDTSEEYEKIMSKSLDKYCEFICKRVSFILATHSKQELLRFYPEFIVDDHGKIWLSHASKISVRKIEPNLCEPEILFKRYELKSAESKERLNKKLQIEVNVATTPNEIRMLGEMSKYFGEIKSRVGINQLFEEKRSDSVCDKAFSRLRPFSPYSLHDVISPQDDKKIKVNRPSSRPRIKVITQYMKKQYSPVTVSTRNLLRTSSRQSGLKSSKHLSALSYYL